MRPSVVFFNLDISNCSVTCTRLRWPRAEAPKPEGRPEVAAPDLKPTLLYFVSRFKSTNSLNCGSGVCALEPGIIYRKNASGGNSFSP